MSYRPLAIETIDPRGLSALQWAFDQIVEGRMQQKDVRAEFNRRVAALGLQEASSSGFNRWSIAIRNGGRRRPQPTEAPTEAPGTSLPQVNPQTIRALAAALVQLADELNGSA